MKLHIAKFGRVVLGRSTARPDKNTITTDRVIPRRGIAVAVVALGFVILGSLIIRAALALPLNHPNSPPAASTPFTLVERGAHHRVWHSITTRTNLHGKVTYYTNSFTEMATGMHFKRNGQWVEANDTIQVNANGSAAFATNTAHQVGFAANLHVAGAIDLLTPHGQHLKSTVLGLSFDDPSTGKNSIIADLQDSTGQILQSLNQVLYTNALVDPESSFNADVLYTHKKGRFEQDIILRSQPPSPVQFGMNPATTRLQVWTEFFAPPEPKISTRTRTSAGQGGRQHVLEDQKLDFGSMQMGLGNAFPIIGATNSAEAALNGTVLVPVTKHWVHQGGRTFLVEEVPLDAIVAQLNALPTSSPLPNHVSAGSGNLQSFFRPPPKEGHQARMNNQPLRLAQADLRNRPGFTLDYDLINATMTNFTFQSDTTYFLSGECDFYETTTLEGGTVIKCETDGEVAVIMNGEIKCLTAPYRPAIFTCTNDNSVGVALSLTHSPTLSISTFLGVLEGGSLSNVRFSYAWNALSTYSTNVQISDCQFINCSHPITANAGVTNLALHNVLITMDDSINNSDNFCGCPPGAFTIYSSTIHVYGEHVTAHLGSQNMITYFMGLDDPSSTSVAFTNSILTTPNVNPLFAWGGAVGYTVGTNFTYVAGTDSGQLFQQSGAANYYLASASPCRNAGTSNLVAATLSDIREKTTVAPLILSNIVISANTNLGLYVLRDGNASPDLGYHYDPLDYIFHGVILSNAAMTLASGIQIGAVNTESRAGLELVHSASFSSTGSPLNLNHICFYNAVQEQSTPIWIIPGGTFLIDSAEDATTDALYLRFSDLSGLGGNAWLIQALIQCSCALSDSALHGGIVTAEWNLNVTNCLFDRAETDIFTESGPFSAVLRNNLFYGTHITLYNTEVITYSWLNNHFTTGCTIYQEGDITTDYNGYSDGADRLTPNGAHDVIVSSSPIFDSGQLGYYYLHSGSALINTGNTTADLFGLYHYTTQTNQTKETNSTVDIGLHYIALNGSGRPIDTDGDGIPDYLEDANGNGSVDSGETNWQDANDLGLKVVITRPKKNSIIP